MIRSNRLATVHETDDEILRHKENSKSSHVKAAKTSSKEESQEHHKTLDKKQ